MYHCTESTSISSAATRVLRGMVSDRVAKV